MIIFQIFFTGGIILLGAILLNIFANFLGLLTWYSFLESKTASPLDMFWLFVVYPSILGLLAFVAVRLLQLH